MSTSPRSGRIRNVLAAAVVAVALAVGGYLVGLDSRPPPAPPPGQSQPETPPEQPRDPAATQAVLGRADIIGIAAAAADSFAGGRAGMGSLAGRRFAVRIPFGCSGPAGEETATGWRYDEAQQSLRVTIAPAEWSEAEWVTGAIPEGSADAIEGFWIPRPWTRSEQCAGNTGEAANWASTVGVAQFFGTDSDRASQRRGRPLEVVAKVEPEAVPAKGLQLVIEGRLADVPGGQSSVLCHAASASQRPTCLVAATFERVSVVDPASGAELANWRL